MRFVFVHTTVKWSDNSGNNNLIWPKVIFFMLNSAEHEIFPLINVKMLTIVGILTFISRKNSILGLSEPEKAEFLDIFFTCEHLKFHALLS